MVCYTPRKNNDSRQYQVGFYLTLPFYDGMGARR